MSEEAYFRIKEGETDESSDKHRSKVSKFLKVNGFPDPDKFACATACINEFKSTDSVSNFGAVIGYIDFDSVANDISIVSLVDLQNAATNNQPERVWVAEGSEKDRRELVLRAIRECPRGRYPEVRIARPLTDSDFSSYDTKGSTLISLMEASEED
jgi:hypothetical protein